METEHMMYELAQQDSFYAGKADEKKEIATLLLKRSYPLEEIKEITKLSLDKILLLKQEISSNQ